MWAKDFDGLCDPESRSSWPERLDLEKQSQILMMRWVWMMKLMNSNERTMGNPALWGQVHCIGDCSQMTSDACESASE